MITCLMRIFAILVIIIPAYGTGSMTPWPINNRLNSKTRELHKPFKKEGRIVGGTAASIADYPYAVSLQFRQKHICGGSILQSSIILTAAHCVLPFQTAAGLWVRAGSSSNNKGGQYIAVLDFVRNEEYNLDKLEKDLALLILHRPLTFTYTVQPIQLADPEDYLPNQSSVKVIGWGATVASNSLPSTHLLAVTVYIVNRTVCYNNYKGITRITTNMVCAAYPNGGKDSCQGDSGGPLVSPNVSSRHFELRRDSLPAVKQFGSVSFGISCAEERYPGVYVNISAMRSWIDVNVKVIKSKYKVLL